MLTQNLIFATFAKDLAWNGLFDFIRGLTKKQVLVILSILVFGGCSSGVEYKIVDLVVAGSRPVIHPTVKKRS